MSGLLVRMSDSQLKGSWFNHQCMQSTFSYPMVQCIPTCASMTFISKLTEVLFPLFSVLLLWLLPVE